MESSKGGKVDFRTRARDAFDRAREHLTSGAPGRLRYAALELRLALEAVSYGTAQAYSEELPESAYEQWQPPKLVELLLEQDPGADQSVRVRIRPDGGGDLGWLDLGTEQRMPLRVLRKFYHSLESLLHTPTLAQMRQGKSFDEGKTARLCEEVVSALEPVLASPLHDVRMRNLGTFECQLCGKVVVRSLPMNKDSATAKCRNEPCKATYDVSILPDGSAVARPRGEKITCPKCQHVLFLFDAELRPGIGWTCNCGAKFVLQLRLLVDEAGSGPATSAP